MGNDFVKPSTKNILNPGLFAEITDAKLTDVKECSEFLGPDRPVLSWVKFHTGPATDSLRHRQLSPFVLLYSADKALISATNLLGDYASHHENQKEDQALQSSTPTWSFVVHDVRELFLSKAKQGLILQKAKWCNRYVFCSIFSKNSFNLFSLTIQFIILWQPHSCDNEILGHRRNLGWGGAYCLHLFFGCFWSWDLGPHF